MGDWIIPSRQERVNHLVEGTYDIGGKTAELHEVRAVMAAAHMAVSRVLSAA
jgi:hypothetical protein